MPPLEEAPQGDDDFTAAFKEFTKPEAKDATPDPVAAPPAPGGEGGQGTDPVAGSESAPVEPAPSADPAIGGEGGVDPSAQPAPAAQVPAGGAPAAPGEPAAAPVVESAPAAPVPVEVKGPSADDILSKLDQIVSRTTAEPAPAPAPAAQPEEVQLYTPEEKTFLEGYEKDWGDVTRGEALRRRAENAEIIQFVFTEVAKVLAPLRETTDVLAQRTHYADIERSIGEYDGTLREQVEAWIKGQPDYLQDTYNRVIDQGTSEQVIDLVARFRKETGAAPQAPAPAPSKKKGNELSDPAKQAAEALAPVETKRTGIEQQDDPNNFDAAFGKFAELLKEK